MYETSSFLFFVFLTILLPYPAEQVCCFGFRKVCESVADVTTYGSDDWTSLMITPGRCENSTLNTSLETISEETFVNVPQLINVYIVDTNVNFEKNCFKPLREHVVYLSVIKNNMSVVPEGVFEDLPKVKKIMLRDSGIKEISQNAFKHLPRLEVLLLSGNQLQDVKTNILNTIDVKTIDLSFNLITRIEPNAFPNNLILLNLKKNNLEEIQDNVFSNLNSLEMLILSKNKIRSICKGTFAGLSSLSKLDLSRNEIDNIEKDTFSDLQELMFLYLKHNNLKILSADVFLKDMINLTDLELDQNQLSFLDENIFKRMPNLEEISINGNPWQCKCLENIIFILTNKSISMSDTDDLRPKCTIKHDTCVTVN